MFISTSCSHKSDVKLLRASMPLLKMNFDARTDAQPPLPILPDSGSPNLVQRRLRECLLTYFMSPLLRIEETVESSNFVYFVACNQRRLPQ